MTEILHWKDVNWTELERIEARCYAANADNEWVPWSIWQSWPIVYRDRIEFRVEPDEAKANNPLHTVQEFMHNNAVSNMGRWLPRFWLGRRIRVTVDEILPGSAPTDWQSKAEAYRKDTINAHAALVETQRELAELRRVSHLRGKAVNDMEGLLETLRKELEARNGK